jgi:hypothetical protein
MPAHPQRSVIPPDLSDADLTETSLVHADRSHARPWRPNLTRANLCEAILVSTDFKNAQILACNVFGISAWELALQGATQSDLIVSHPLERSVTPVDSLELAQFIYLLLNNERLRTVIDTITSKVVVILGRFTPDRKRVLDAIRAELRCRNYLPVVFDFQRPSRRDAIETVSTLAHMARFVIADLSSARSALQELQRIVPHLPSVPVQPLLQSGAEEPGMLDHLRGFATFLPLLVSPEIWLLLGADALRTRGRPHRRRRDGEA